MDNFNRKTRNGTEIDNNIPGMDMKPERNEYKNVGRKKNKNIKIRQFAALIGRLNFLRPQIKEASLYLIKLDKAKTQALKTGSWDGIMIVNRVVIKELKWWIRRIGDNQPESLSNKTITCMLTTDASPQGRGSDADTRELDRTYTTRLLERKGSGNVKQCQRNKSYLLRATPFRASLQEDARSGSLDTFRQHNSSLRYWEMESEGIPDRKNKTGILSGEKTQTTDHNNPHSRKTELNNRFTLETMQIGRLLTEGRNDLNDLQDMELHATDRHIRNTIQQTNQQLCNSGSQRTGDTFPQCVQLQMEQSQIIHPSTYTSIKQSITENEVRQSTGNSNSTDLAGAIVVHQTKEFILQIPFPWISKQDSGDGTENERQGSKTSTRQCWRLPSGPVADVWRDLLMICMKMRGFSEDGVNLLFKGQRFKTFKRDFYSLALLPDLLDIERITIEEMMKRDAEVILIEVIAFCTRQNNLIAQAKSHKACLTTMPSLIYKENRSSSTTSKPINKALANATIPDRRY
ncbi:MAG: hypothetical protein EZS28_009909 [Streblomastix strix]|uniref:Uncharacterized protein n=1 Tax=Streblomastix strix TaxID=222440 RepID=A0A5J4WI22_9EUKA|nr:MAG: hypothetical protein EZS28_009909 [Streblomastix strix]